jgi:hypothetical protein
MGDARTASLAHWFTPWETREMQTWLESKAKEGWLLRSCGWLMYRFEKSDPSQWTYRIDYQASIRNFDREEYLRIFSDSGWELAAEYAGWFYFRTPRGEGAPPEIYTDPASRMGMFKRLYRLMLLLFGLCGCLPLWNAVVQLFNRDISVLRSAWDYILIVSVCLSLIAVSGIGYSLLRLRRYIRREFANPAK